MNVAQETLGFRRAGLSPALSLLMSAFALPIPPARVTLHLHRPTERSPTMYAIPSACSVTHDSTLIVALASAVTHHHLTFARYIRAKLASSEASRALNILRWIAYIRIFGY